MENILKRFYNINVEKIELLYRDDVDYNKNKNRKVYIINDIYILKKIFTGNIEFLEELYQFLNKKKVNNYISPILNSKKKYVTVLNNETIILLFNKYDLKFVGSSDLKNILNIYFNLYEIVKIFPKKYLPSFYLNNIKYFLVFTKKIKFFKLILKNFGINIKNFYTSIEKYILYLEKKNNLEGIYSSFWLGNIYKIDRKIVFLDLDSIQKGDILYDIISILNVIYILYKYRIDIRYKYYSKVINYYKNIINYDILQGFFYYYTFRIILDIDDRKIDLLLKDINNTYKFMLDFNNFLNKYVYI